MANTLHKALALLLAFSLSAGLLCLPALAEETTTAVNDDGTVTEATTSTTTATDPDTGNVTVMAETIKTTTGVTGEGVAVNRVETYTETTVTSAGGALTARHWTEKGAETTQRETKAAQQLPVTVPLAPGKTTSASDTSTTVTGDVPAGEDDPEYNYTATETRRTVTAVTGELKTTVTETSAGLTPVGPEAYEGRQGVFDEHFKMLFDLSGEEAPDGYSYRYAGYGEHSKYYVNAIIVHYETDEQGNTVISHLTSPGSDTPLTVGGQVTTDIHADFDQGAGSRASMFQLLDKGGNPVFAYCVDLQTLAVRGAWYSVANLEDGTYYATADAAGHIRAIVTNGYWGTGNQADENGGYQTGSLAGIKAALLAAIAGGEIENASISTDSGTILLSDAMAELTEGEALLATQAAIWSYSNGSLAVATGQDGSLVISPSYDRYNSLGPAGVARVEALYAWLTGLEAEQPSTTVINQKNFVSDLSLTVGDRTEDGAYEAAVSFTLDFTPGTRDDLLLSLTYTGSEGESVTVTRRLAGENSDGESWETLSPVDGVYTIDGLTLGAGQSFTFDLRVAGEQYLEQDVYIYTAQNGASQTFVGLAEGSRSVDAVLSLTASFTVAEGSTVRTARAWVDGGSYVPQAPTVPETPVIPETPVVPETPTIPETPVVPEIPDDPEAPVEEETPIEPETPVETETPVEETPALTPESPLASVPKTGTRTVLLALLTGLSGGGLAGMALAGKIDEDEEEEKEE